MFYALPATPTYALIVVDEAQNLSLRQLQNIHQLAINQAVLYCMDPQQNIVDQAPIKTLWQQCLWPKTIESISLNQTYRCKEQITLVVNALLQVKHDMLGKMKQQNRLTHDLHNDPGYVAFTSRSTLNEHATILERHSSNHFAVITNEELVEEAKHRFNTPLVFTVQQIQGLEYHTVLMYNLMTDKQSQENLKTVHQHLESGKKYDKISSLDVWFSTLYTACTRARHTLLICEDTNPRFNGLMQKLQQSIQHKKTDAQPQPITLPVSNWEDEIKKQKDAGNDCIAEQIKARGFSDTKPPVPKKNKQKKTKPTALQSKARDIFTRFNESGVISNWVKQPHFMATLFNTPFSLDNDTAKTLFAHITQCDARAKRFAFAIRMPTLQFVTTDFIARATSYPDLPGLIITELVTAIFTRQRQALNEPFIAKWIFLHACVDPESLLNFIAMIIEGELMIPESTMVEILTDIPPKSPTTLLWLLASHREGYPILDTLFTKHSNIINNMSPQAWAFSPQENEYKNMSTLYCLAANPKGLILLEKLIENHPDIINNIPPETWLVPAQEKNKKRMSPLLWLTSVNQGLIILAKLIEGYPHIINNIATKTWAETWPMETNADENVSPLLYLSLTPEGRAILANLVEHHSSIIKKIPTKEWGRAVSVGKFKSISPIYFLSINPDGQNVLSTLANYAAKAS